MKKTQKILLISSLVFGAGLLSSSIGITLAGYVRSQTVKDPENGANVEIAGEGIRKKNYYLDLGIWATDQYASTYNIWAVIYNNATGTGTCVYLLGSDVGSNKFRFNFDAVYYDRIQFLRIKTNASDPRNGTYSDSYMIGHDGSLVYNASHTVTPDSTLTTFKINSWSSSGDYSYLSDGAWY